MARLILMKTNIYLIICVLMVSLAYAAYPVEDPVFYWKAIDDELDYPSGHIMTEFGDVRHTNSYAYDFSSSNYYMNSSVINVPSSNGHTICLTYYFDTCTLAQYDYPLTIGDAVRDNSTDFIQIYSYNFCQNMQFRWKDGGTEYDTLSMTRTTGNWNWICNRQNGSNSDHIESWVNGTHQSTSAVATDMFEGMSAQYYSIGFGQTVSSLYARGYIGNIFIYNYSLTDSEMQSLRLYEDDTTELDDCTTLSDVAINFTMRNITDNSRINGSMEYYFEYGTKTYSTSYDSANYTKFCIQDTDLKGVDVMVEYSIKEDEIFTYYFNDTTLNTTTPKEVDLYVTGGTTQVMFTVRDTSGSTLPDAYIKVMRWDTGTGSFRLQSVLETDSNGESVGYIVLNNEWYKFIIEYQGNIYLETEPTRITSTTVNFQINLVGDYAEEYAKVFDVSGTVTFSNTTKYFTFTYNDAASEIDEACLDVNLITLTGETQVNHTCDTGYSGSLIRYAGSNASIGTNTLSARGYVVIDGTQYTIDTLTVSFDTGYKKYGTDGVFISFLVILTVAMIGIWSPFAAILLMIIGIIAMSLMGIMYFNALNMFLLVLLGVITMFKINQPQR